eukprot:744914_1
MNMAHILNQLRSFTKHIVAGVGRMEVSLYNPLSTLLRFFANDNPLVIEGLHDLEISQQLKTLNMDNLSSHTKRNQMIESLSQTLPDLQGNANTFKRIRFKAILSSYYASYFEIERMPIHQWTPTQVAFSFFVYLVQQRSLSTYVWQFVHHMALLCQEEALNGIVLYQLITKQNQKQNNLMQFTHRICNQFNLNALPLVQQMQNEIKSWAQNTLERAEIWFTPPCKRTPPHIEHPYHVFIEQKEEQSGAEDDVCRDSLDFDRIGAILSGVYEGFECNDLIECIKKHKYTKQNLMDDLCDMVLGGEQNYVLLYQILYDEMNITDAEKRQKIYSALLFQYIEPNHDLNVRNVWKIASQWMWYRDQERDNKEFDLKTFFAGRITSHALSGDKSYLLQLSFFSPESWKPADEFNIMMFDPTKHNKEKILPNSWTSPLDILCHVFGGRLLSQKLHDLDIAAQCEYLKMNNMNTQQKRKQFINKISNNIHTRIQLNHVLLKYRQNIADLSLYDVHEWTPRHLLLSFVYYCIAKAETDPKMWGFVGHFSSYCVESFYDGNAFIDTDGDTQDKISGFDGIIKKFNLDVKLQTILWMDYPAGIIEEWIVEISKIERRSWEHVTCALRHELYGQIASRLNVIVDEYSIISDENVDTALNSLKEKSKLDAKEMEYIKCLIRRAMSSRSTSQYNTMNNSLDITSEMVGLGTQMCSDIYNVHNWFLFVNYRGEEYGKDMFKNKVMKHMECSHLQEEDVIDMMQRMSFIDLYPDYIIDDNRDLIWRYFFAASQLVHTLLSNELNDQAFA